VRRLALRNLAPELAVIVADLEARETALVGTDATRPQG
jgi:hypothetical protein